ncbi:cysteine-rich RECEPTOR-like kinase [Rhynchospora pubera]|uniref:Cysteine-rich RECEPTOR-like kinase n=1 Tax=Rhynchospora pubera TaxID=906938 RepID=A0AAV8GEC1_9POAL|nr:cysteine-rich RECEPTOR-like kinase [Rhynchospora pubera]
MPVPVVILVLTSLLSSVASGDPQTTLLNSGCSQYNATPSDTFLTTLNATFADLNATISLSNFSNFATSSQPRAITSVYALLQCRTYLSKVDCMTCFSTAVNKIRTCGAANGARVIYDGCMLRYESNSFFDQGTQVGNTQLCNGSANGVEGSAAEIKVIVQDLVEAVPKISGYAAAVEKDGVYTYAQCVETVTRSTCQQCLQVAQGNIDNCLPNAFGRGIDAGCFMRYSNVRFFETNQTTDLTPYLKSGGSSKKGAIIGGVVGGVGFLALLVIFLLIKRSRDAQTNRRGSILGATELQGPLKFHYKDLKSATKDFSEENKLGAGGFGDVYKGLLKNGTIVAVKRLAIFKTSRAKIDFESEVKLISNVHHRNLVRLLGCSSKGNDLLLVYEYMANGSLDKFLFGEKKGALSWKQRHNIVIGMARGLAYLHQEFHVCIIHRDIKSNNILLDENFQPKIGDFGLARLLPHDLSHLSTNFAGTLGYTAPEYAIHGTLSEKADTYSYGVVVLEIISGRKCNDMNLKHTAQYLPEWAWTLYETNEPIALVDKSLDVNEDEAQEIERVIKIALMCTQSTVAARPAMSDVVVMLLSKGGSLLEPTKPTFIDAGIRSTGDTAYNYSSSASGPNAAQSISEISAR